MAAALTTPHKSSKPVHLHATADTSGGAPLLLRLAGVTQQTGSERRLVGERAGCARLADGEAGHV